MPLFISPSKRPVLFGASGIHYQQAVQTPNFQKTPVSQTIETDTVCFGLGLRKPKRPAPQFEISQAVGTLSRAQKKAAINILNATHKKAEEGTVRNISGRAFATTLASNTRQTPAIRNVEADRSNTICDLRLADAFLDQADDQSTKLPDATTEHSSTETEETANQPRVPVKAMYHTASGGDAQDPIPCNECQDWISRSPHFEADTLVYRLVKSADLTQADTIQVNRLSEFLPIHFNWRENPVSYTTTEGISTLANAHQFSISADALQTMHTKQVSFLDLQNLLAQTQTQFNQNPIVNRSGHDMTTGVLLRSTLAPLVNNQEKLALYKHRYEFKRTHPTMVADERAVAEGVEQMIAKLRQRPDLDEQLNENNPKKDVEVVALTYYGKAKQLPPVKTLQNIIRRDAPLDTLIVTVETPTSHIAQNAQGQQPVIQVRTAREFFPIMYITP